MATSAISHLMKSITYKRQNHRFRVFRQSLEIYGIAIMGSALLAGSQHFF